MTNTDNMRQIAGELERLADRFDERRSEDERFIYFCRELRAKVLDMDSDNVMIERMLWEQFLKELKRYDGW